PQTERVDAEDAGVADADQDPGGSLGKRSDGGAPLHIRVLKVGAHPLHLVDDRREEKLDRFDHGQSVTDHQRADRRIDVLRIAAIARERKAERARLLAKPADRVDLTVVREHREWLHAREARRRVRRIAVVSERGRRREAWIGEVGEVRRELMTRPAELVDGRMARQAHHRRGSHSLDVDAGLVKRARSEGGAARREERELKEPRSLDASPRTERGVVRRLASDEDGLDAAAGEDREDGSDIGGIVVEKVPDRETLQLHGRLIAARPLELVRPQRARDVGQYTGAITFAVDDTRSMSERSHTVEYELEDRARGPAVLG